MVSCSDTGVYVLYGMEVIEDTPEGQQQLRSRISKAQARQNTMAYGILQSHNLSGAPDVLKLKFDAMVSHDMTYVSIIQTARASGLSRFPMPYVLTNCHNSLCAVGGTLNGDDYAFGLSAAKKYGGIYVPPYQAVIHQYMREMMVGCGQMVLGSDTHTRYGALGALAIGEGGGELVKQLLNQPYQMDMPPVVGVHMTGAPVEGVGPQDIALAIIGAVYKQDVVKNAILEFFGSGIKNLNIDSRNAIDVMTTETGCLSSVWQTDDKVRQYLEAHGREGDFALLAPGHTTYYDGLVSVDLSAVRPMIAMPWHSSHIYTIEDFNANLADRVEQVERMANAQLEGTGLKFSLKEKIHNHKLLVDQGVIAGCAGGSYDSICDAADILAGASIGFDAFSLSVYPASQPIYMEVVQNGAANKLLNTGATLHPAFCGPCFGASDVPFQNGLSIRHITRNFAGQEGAHTAEGQLAAVALMDARSIAATALNHGFLTPATEVGANFTKPKYYFNKNIYNNRVYNGYNNPDETVTLQCGPNITDWPAFPPMTEDVLIQIVSSLTDPVITTEALMPSRASAVYRSNPLAMANFALCEKDPGYVERAKVLLCMEDMRRTGQDVEALYPDMQAMYDNITRQFGAVAKDIALGSSIYAPKIGEGSAREQAASCQRVLGGLANIAEAYATKRYRSNLINWGMLPFCIEEALGDFIYIPNIKDAIITNKAEVTAYNATRGMAAFTLHFGPMSKLERDILLDGCLMNFYQ